MKPKSFFTVKLEELHFMKLHVKHFGELTTEELFNEKGWKND